MASLSHKDLLGIEQLSVEEITLILDTAEALREVSARPVKKVPTLRGKTVINLFFEPSTRTRSSFEVAEKTAERRYPEFFAIHQQRLQGRDSAGYGAQP